MGASTALRLSGLSRVIVAMCSATWRSMRPMGTPRRRRWSGGRCGDGPGALHAAQQRPAEELLGQRAGLQQRAQVDAGTHAHALEHRGEVLGGHVAALADEAL